VLDSQIPGSFTPIPLDQIQILDPTLIPQVMVQSAGAGRSATQTLQVQARLVNCTDATIAVEARTHFIAPSGASNEPISAWKRIDIPQRGLGVYAESSMGTTQADKFLVESPPREVALARTDKIKGRNVIVPPFSFLRSGRPDSTP
jgi:hypothetical protein